VAAAVALAVLLFTMPRVRLFTRPPRAWLHVALVGAMGSGAVVLLAVYAMTETTATNRSLFQSMYPVATAIAARLLLGERLRPSVYGIIAFMCIGLFLMNTGPRGPSIGLAFWLLAATLPLIGLADVYAKRTLEDAHPGFVVTGRFLFGMLVLLAGVPFTTQSEWIAAAGQWPWLVAAGAATAAGVLGLYRTMDRAGASLAASFVALAPVITALGERIVLSQAFSAVQLAGLAVVVTGAVLLARRT
jgi:drug/metabolite transporter (DMT)-like permease